MSDAPRVLIIENDLPALGYLSGLIGKAGYVTLSAPSGKEGLIEAWRHRPALIVIDADLPDLSGLEITRKLRGDQRTAQTKLLLLSTRAQPEDILSGMQAGADEYLAKRPGVDAELLERIQALVPVHPAPVAPEKPSGQIISFLSAKGGTGTSSLCANMAQILSGLVAPKTIAVVDLVLPIGSISQIVGVASPNTVVEATLLEPHQITPDEMRAFTPRVAEWRFHLLPGAPDPEVAQKLQVGRLEAVFAALGQTFDYVLVDFGRALSRISLPFIRISTRVVLILGADASTVALSKTTLKYLEHQGVRRNQIYPILNRAVGLEGMTKAEMERELALSIPGIVPHMSGAFALANNLHQSIAVKFPNDSATFALHSLTAGLLSQVEAAVPKPAAT